MATKRYKLHRGLTRTLGIDLTKNLGKFDPTELLTGSPTVTPEPIGLADAGKLTTANPAVNTDTFEDEDGNTVAVGKGVLFDATAAADAVVGAEYKIKIRANTSVSGQVEGDDPILEIV